MPCSSKTLSLPGKVITGGFHGVEKDRVGRGHVDGVVQLPLVFVPDKILKIQFSLQPVTYCTMQMSLLEVAWIPHPGSLWLLFYSGVFGSWGEFTQPVRDKSALHSIYLETQTSPTAAWSWKGSDQKLCISENPTPLASTRSRVSLWTCDEIPVWIQTWYSPEVQLIPAI